MRAQTNHSRRCRSRFVPTLQVLESRDLLATCTVTSVADTLPNGVPGELRYCVREVNAGNADHINFDLLSLPTGTINLQAALPAIINPVFIEGPGTGDPLITVRRQDGVGQFRVFRFESAAGDVHISRLAIANGLAHPSDPGGAGIWSAARLRLTRCHLLDNRDPNGSGGGLFVASSGTTTVEDLSLFQGNSVSTGPGTGAQGGAIYNSGSQLTIRDTKFRDNFVECGASCRGGAISTRGTTVIERGTFEGNEATGVKGAISLADGGAILNYEEQSMLTITDSVFGVPAPGLGGNSSTGTVATGGAIHNEGIAEVTGTTSFFLNFTGGSGVGGAIYNRGQFTVRNGQFGMKLIGNSAGEGGAIYNIRKFTIENSRFVDNEASNGGAIYNSTHFSDGFMTIQYSTLSENQAVTSGTNVGRGGAIDNRGVLTVERSTIDNNLARFGAGIYNLREPFGEPPQCLAQVTSIQNSTISANIASADSTAGGIHNTRSMCDSIVDVRSSTISNNSAESSVGTATEIYVASDPGIVVARVQYRNTIINGIGARPNCFASSAGVLLSSGYNIGRDGSCNLIQASDRPNTNPQIDVLGDYFGPTRTHRLLPGSPAINTGNSMIDGPWDQRGSPFERVVNSVIDVGSFECQLSECQGGSSPGFRPDLEWEIGIVEALAAERKPALLSSRGAVFD